MFLLFMKSQLERKVNCLPQFKNENWSTSLAGYKILLTAHKVQLLARLVFNIVSIFTHGKFSQELPCVIKWFLYNSFVRKIHTLPRCGLFTIQIPRHSWCPISFKCGFVCQAVFFLTSAVLQNCRFTLALLYT